MSLLGRPAKPAVPTARICHVPTVPSVSWYEFACEIFRQARNTGPFAPFRRGDPGEFFGIPLKGKAAS